MRTLRLSLVGTAILVLLVGLGGAVAAQDESPSASGGPPSGPAIVSGEEDCSKTPCDERLSDPRVTGAGWVTFLGQHPAPGGSALWGSFRLEGPEGDWIGPWVGMCIDGLGRCEAFVTMEGTAAYEGWSFVATFVDEGGGPGQVDGIIYEGEAVRQEWPEPSPSPASE